jgi:modulator of FtsH protease HflK
VQALIDFIIRNLLALWPIARVYSWQQGVRLRGGILREELPPGLHWRWWFIDEVYRITVAEQTLDLAVGACTTRDGRSVAVSANLAYRIVSVRQMWAAVDDVKCSIRNVALGYLVGECSRQSWDTLTTGRDDVQAQLAAYMTRQLAIWGVEVTRVHITDLVEARQYRLFGDAPTGKAA